MATSLQYNEYVRKAPNLALMPEDVFEKILENSFAVLIGLQEVHSVDYSSNEAAKSFYAFLIAVTSDFTRHNSSLEDIEHVLSNSCGIGAPRLQKYLDYYVKNKYKIMFSLLNLGTYLPHLTDVTWKIDYIVKSSMIEDSEGPVFRISLSTEKYDDYSNAIKNTTFTCTSQELQDLVYKLKDALRHCNTVANRM